MTTTFWVPSSVAPAAGVAAQRWGSDAAQGPVVVLAHGAGSRLEHPLHQAICAAVAAHGHTVVAFDFPYARAGRKAPDRMPVLQACYRDVIGFVRAEMPRRPLVIGGRSMGGRVASLLAADGVAVDGLALLNYPVVAVNAKADTPPRTAHWDRLSGPILFVQGTRDRLFDREIFTGALPKLNQAQVTIVDIPDADHSFGVLRRSPMTATVVYAHVGTVISDWLGASVRTSAESAP